MNKKILLALVLSLLTIPGVYAATNYYASTVVYFNVPSDASFAIAMPADYTSFTDITGTIEGSATATDWISFNFTNVPENWVEPYQHGVSSDSQAGITKPIFYIDNTGNVDEKFELYWAGSLPTGIAVCGNSSCTGTCSDSGTISTCTEIGENEGSATTFASTIKTDEYLNITLYANVSSGTAAGQTSQTLYIKSTAV